MKARFKYRIYPKPHQIEPLAKAFGCARVVWNDALAIYQEAANNKQPLPKEVDKLVITQAKKTPERTWLSEVSNIVLQQSFRDLRTAWSNYFNSLKGKRKGKKVGRPQFKKKQSRQAIRFRVGGFSVHSCSVKLTKIGHIKMEVSRPLPSKPSSVTIIKDATDRYFASFVVEVEPKLVPQVENSLGIDLGLTHFAILSNGEKVENPRYHKKLLKRIKKGHRRFSKCQKGSKRREVAKLKLAKLHAKVKDARNDFLQKLTTKLVRENQALAIEDLNVSGLVKNRKLSRAISDAGWYSFRSMLSAKCDRDGRHLVIIDRWEATSQKCSHCGFRGGKKDLSIREWTCLNCGTTHDRDINAANNIKVEGLRSEMVPTFKRSVAGGLSETKNGRGRKCKTSVEAVSVEPLTNSKYVQLNLF